MILRALMIAAVGLTLTIANADAQTKGPNGGIVVKVDDQPIEFVFQRPGDRLLCRRSRRQADADQGAEGEGGRAGRRQDHDDCIVAGGAERFVGKLAAPLGAKARVVFSSFIRRPQSAGAVRDTLVRCRHCQPLAIA